MLDRISLLELKKSIFKGYWLSVTYLNAKKETTRYWINILDIDPSGCIVANGFKTDGSCSLKKINMRIDNIQSCSVVKDTYHKTNEELVKKIIDNASDYSFIYPVYKNYDVLSYYSECYIYDTQPYQSNYKYVSNLDDQVISKNGIKLSETQFKEIASKYRYREEKNDLNKIVQEICMNILSIETPKGLYVLAYRKLNLDIETRMLTPDENITINYEFIFDINDVKSKASISQFLSEEDQYLLEDFDANRKEIRERIEKDNPEKLNISDNPYIIYLSRNLTFDINREYDSIIRKMTNNEDVPVPIRTFLGEQIEQKNRVSHPIILFDNQKTNLDQLNAINKALKNDITYVQGPPGTGKTNTILSVILSSIFNNFTVLVTSYNNHPMNGIYSLLRGLKYKNQDIPLPILRLGNNDLINEALDEIKELYAKCSEITIYEISIEKNKKERTEQTKSLSDILKKYEEKVELENRRQILEDIIGKNSSLLSVNLQTGQLETVKQRIEEIGEIRSSTALKYIDEDVESIRKYLYYSSAKRIQNLKESRYKPLMGIVNMPSKTDNEQKSRCETFNKYISVSDNVELFLKIFPIIITTNSSAHKLGSPDVYFDLTIMDEAGQCDSATSLIPISRGHRLLLVGDPQQLKPVIVLDPRINKLLMSKYKINTEYDYIEKSIYKAFLSLDFISDEILLRNHYRCSPKIMEFNNRKFYNNQLIILSKQKEGTNPLQFVDINKSQSNGKNTSLSEANQIIDYIKEHPNENIGVITPFARQRELLDSLLIENNIGNRVTCGTVHAFQGDEKDTVLFSAAITKDTHHKTYEWLSRNSELINVATSRAKDKLIIFCDRKELNRLSINQPKNDFKELCEYTINNGDYVLTNSSDTTSRALGYKPYTTETEEQFLASLEHALEIVANQKCVIHHNVAIKDLFEKFEDDNGLFFTGHFDFVIYSKNSFNKDLIPIIAFEINGPEHYSDDNVMERDRKKIEIAKRHNLELISLKNSYSRRYYEIKDMLIEQLKNS
ncbi:MAG: AAA domain-containing protein [Erysipelotrichaceae bacterium]|nr:AAA domain-containing protein [Erysipelotrichaceae bacterium]